MTGNIPNLDLVNMYTYMILRELLSTCLQVIEGNKFLVSIKGHNSVTNLRKMTGDNPNLDIVDMNAYI